jgi:hypothetical protein
MEKQLFSFYSNNLEVLDDKWKKFCVENFKGRELGDMYHNSNAFWRFVEKEFTNDGIRKRAS